MEIKKLILDEIKSISFVQLGLDDSIIDSQLLDSIGIIDLVIFIEENIGIKIYIIQLDSNLIKIPT